jgi:hypothetical protein
MEKEYWFKRRRYGYGWIPSTRQGWGVLIVYLVLVVGLASAFLEVGEDPGGRQAGFFLAFFVLLTGCLIMVTLKKGPAPKWRWGRRDGDNPAEDF